MANAFEVMEVEMRDLGVASALEFHRLNYRRDVPVILLCRLPSLKHTSVIRCSPLDTYFCAVTDYRAFFHALYAYESTLVKDDSFYAGFLKEMRRSGIKKDLLPRSLFSGYSLWGAYGSQQRGTEFGKQSGNDYSLVGRAVSAVVSDDAVQGVIDYWTRQLVAFGEQATCPAPESLNEFIDDPRFNLVPQRSRLPYLSPDYEALSTNLFLEPRQEELAMSRLRSMVSLLEQGEVVVPDLFPLHVIRCTPSVSLNADDPPTRWERAYLRSRLIRLLGYVWHYSSVIADLDALKRKSLQVEGKQAKMLDDILTNLDCYISDMQSKYPVIEENPLAA